MRAWFENIAGPQYATGVMWTIAALILLLVLLVVARIIRNLTAGTFVAGGRNRRTRLAVMDAAAVDSQRRLVLVRRDDVEHLILIGGPTDVVIEQNIVPAESRPKNQARMEEPVVTMPPVREAPRKPEKQEAPPPSPAPEPVQVEKTEPAAPVPPPPAPPAPAAPKQAPEPAAISNLAPAAPDRRAYRVETAANTAPSQQEAAQGSAPKDAGPEEEFQPAPPVQPVYPVVAPAEASQPPVNDIDRALAAEIETASVTKAEPEIAERPKTLEDEMSRLLGQISRERG